ncbi:MAG: MgtC/SapB family protein [Armatimonadetes bacterium]|nr:MgtC/SapB family protein [Armatimonadota bacterium]
MDPAELGSAALKLALACFLGGLVGWQREAHDRPAGFRTHILVCVGSCLVMIVSIGAAASGGPGAPRYDPGRIAAQVVSGIGFLGAGTILRQGSVVRGLTTAASLWTVAAIGLAAGLGGSHAVIAGLATLFVLATLTVFSRLEARLIEHRQLRDLNVTIPRDQVVGIVRFFAEHGVGVKTIESERSDVRGSVRLHLVLRIPRRVDTETLTHDLLTRLGVQEIDWE